MDQFRGFTPTAPRQQPLCFGTRSSTESSPNWRHKNILHVKKIVSSCSLPLGTVVAGPAGHAWSRFVSTTHAVLHKAVTIPVSKHHHSSVKSELSSSWLPANLGVSTACNVVQVWIQISVSQFQPNYLSIRIHQNKFPILRGGQFPGKWFTLSPANLDSWRITLSNTFSRWSCDETTWTLLSVSYASCV